MWDLMDEGMDGRRGLPSCPFMLVVGDRFIYEQTPTDDARIHTRANHAARAACRTNMRLKITLFYKSLCTIYS